MEVAVRWSHLSTPADPTFLIADVTGRTFKLCRAGAPAADGSLRWDELARNAKAPAFRAFDWSPRHGLVAVGQWSGETAILGVRERPHGSAGAAGDLGPLALPIKSQRQCNAVAFNMEALLATGLERVRNDFCLNVYDLSQWLRSPPSSSGNGIAGGGATPTSVAIDPVRKLATSEGITSIKFLPQQPQVLVAGVKGACVRVYDLRDGASGPALQFQTPCVHNLAVDPADANYFASAAPTRDAVVHVWDCRSVARPPAGGSFTSSLGGTPGGAYQDAPALELRDVFDGGADAEAASVWSLRWSLADRGSLGVLGSTGCFRVFKTQKDFAEAERPASNGHQGEAMQPVSVSRSYTLDRCQGADYSSANGSGGNEDRILAFDFMNALSRNAKPCALTLRGNQDIAIFELHGPPPSLATSVRASVAVSGQGIDVQSMPGLQHLDGLIMYQAIDDGHIADTLIAVRQSLGRRGKEPDNSPPPQDGGNSNAGFSEGWNDDEQATAGATSNTSKPRRAARDGPPGTIRDALLLADAPRRRCVEGYLFDNEKNRHIVGDDKQLQWMWAWLSTAAQNAAGDKMVSGGVDFSFLGVHSIWNEDLGLSPTSRTRSDSSDGSIADAIKNLVSNLRLPDVALPESTKKAAHRRLCFHSLGLFPKPGDGNDPNPLLAQIKILALAGNSHEGALRAVLHGDSALAATALRSGPRSHQHPALSLLLSLHKTASPSPELRAQITALASTTTSPHLLALLAHLSGNVPTPPPDLPPLYPLASALLLLSDNALSAYLAQRHRTALAIGNPAHLPLTGLALPAVVSLFATYMARTADLQTAVLALAPAVPRYGRNTRVDAWRQAYRVQLNAQRLFLQRARFDAGATRLAAPDGAAVANRDALVPNAPRQVSLKCPNCDAALHREAQAGQKKPDEPQPADGAGPALSGAGKRGGRAGGAAARGGGVLGGSGDGTACPRCGARLPRCAVCDHWVGGIDPHSRAARSETDKQKVEKNGDVPPDGKRGSESMTRDALAEFIHVCLMCAHVYHRAHASAWFARYAECAAIGCRCRCDGMDSDAIRI